MPSEREKAVERLLDLAARLKDVIDGRGPPARSATTRKPKDPGSSNQARSGKAARPQEVPRWDGRELRWGGQLLRRYGKAAPVQWLVLDALEAGGWQPRVPLPSEAHGVRVNGRTLRFTVNKMSKRFEKCGLRLGMDGTGRGLCWERC